MTNPTPHGQVPEALIDLIDAYAETRYRYGGIYNARTEAARKAVIEALSGVQALSAAPAGWKLVPVEPDISMQIAAKKADMDHSPLPDWLVSYWPEFLRIWHEMLAASPTPPAEQQATKETSGGFHVWRDISTAPKDGSRFVATGHNYGLYSEVRHTCVAQWFRGCWMEASDWNETSELKYLTHWMPLPSPPDDVAAPAEQQAAPKAAQCEMDKEASNVRLDIDSNSTKPEQQRDVACSLEVGQHVGNGEHQGASCRGSKDSELLKIAVQNLKYFIEHAQFSSFADKRAALNCLDALATPPAQQAAPKAAPVVWLSSKQLRGVTALHGQYLPFRRQTEGLFDTPVYLEQAAPKAAPGEPDPADIIAGALQISRGHAIEMMREALEAAPQQEAQEPVAWESTILGYIKYITQAQYEKFRPNVRRWYKPYKCSSCAAPQPAPAPLSRDQIREVFMTHGFTVKEGQTDLKQYVYDAAYALLGTKPAPLSDDDVRDAARYRWLRDTSNADDPSHMIALHIRDEQNDASLSGIDAAIDAALAAQGDTP